MSAADVLAIASIVLSVVSLVASGLLCWVNETRAKEQRYLEWSKELSKTGALHSIAAFRRKCKQLEVHYALAFLMHRPLMKHPQTGGGLAQGECSLQSTRAHTAEPVTWEDFDKVEIARATLAEVYDGIKLHFTTGQFPANASYRKLLTKRAKNYLTLVECIDAANWYLMGNNKGERGGDYVTSSTWNEDRPSR
jgi:hypothetical protein